LNPLPLARVRVADTSMLPALRPGDRLLVGRWLRLRLGDVVVLRDPEAPLSFLIKRVVQVEPNGDLLVHGDNPNVSRDSRHFGAIKPEFIVGRVFYRYLPGARRGRL
jgi:nickel-type superoxide dismutase maturation protease